MEIAPTAKRPSSVAAVSMPPVVLDLIGVQYDAHRAVAGVRSGMLRGIVVDAVSRAVDPCIDLGVAHGRRGKPRCLGGATRLAVRRTGKNRREDAPDLAQACRAEMNSSTDTPACFRMPASVPVLSSR